jgi:hypothetical protein
MTPHSAWWNIRHLIPSDKVIWEPFYGDGNSGRNLQEMGFDVIHEDEDFFEHNKGDIIISNPPFTRVKDVLTRLKELGKPFILILPCSKLHTVYFRELFGDERVQIIVPRRRIQFLKTIDNVVPDDFKPVCNFDCYYYTWKLGLEKDVVWLKG